jgi:hypothetical protein
LTCSACSGGSQSPRRQSHRPPPGKTLRVSLEIRTSRHECGLIQGSTAG